MPAIVSRTFLLTLVCALALGLAACSADDGADDQAGAGGSEVPAAGQEPGMKPEFEVPEGDPPAELVTEDLIEGEGEAAQDGDTLTVHYVGKSYSTGQQFDASWDRGETFEVTLGAGEVIPGWEQGLEGMKVGGRRMMIIPPELAYGERGAGGGAIGPNETLVFVVDLLEIS